MLSPALEIVAVTDAYLAATMTRREAILGRGIFDVFPDNPDDPAVTGQKNLRCSLETVLRTGRPDAMAVQKYDIRRPAAEGGSFEERYWSPLNVPIFGSDGAIRFVLHRVEDVTEFVRLKRQAAEVERLDGEMRARSERMEAEVYERAQQIQEKNQRLFAQLAQSQKMEAVGLLAGGIAHDFNNLLTLIVGYSELLLDDLKPGDHTHAELEAILGAARRAGALTRQILVFSRRHPAEMVPTDLNRIVREADQMLRRVIGEHIELVIRLEPDLRTVIADPGRIHQVVMNLAINARDAMPAGGRLTITTANQDLDELFAQSHVAVTPGPYAMLTVSDTGCGMSSDVLAHVFEPFFTTKDPGKGTGLGLAMVHGIVEQCRGHVRVYSEEGRGSTFKIYLPETEQKPVILEAKPAAPEARGTETLLLVEDDDDIRRLTRRILEQSGYSVLECSNAGEALMFVEQGRATAALLLTDIVMPRMSGIQLARRLRSRTPDMKVLFMSGFTEHPTLDDAEFVEGALLIHKPFSRLQLLAKLRELLDPPRIEPAGPAK